MSTKVATGQVEFKDVSGLATQSVTFDIQMPSTPAVMLNITKFRANTSVNWLDYALSAKDVSAQGFSIHCEFVPDSYGTYIHITWTAVAAD